METGDEWQPPSLDKDFTFSGGFIPGVDWVNKPFIQAIIAAVIILVFWLVVSRKLKVVPSKSQFLAESAYNFVRNGIGRDMIGGKDFHRYVPYLVALFFFVLVNNLFGLFFPFMYPTTANIGYVWGMALLSWVIYNVAGFHKHGLKYIKLQTVPGGTPWWLLPLLIPIEFLSNFIVRPLTLALRLFGNMLAGHAMVLVFVVGGTFLLTSVGNIGLQLAGGVALIFSFAIFAFELLVAGLQAYIFAVLSAVYVSSAISDDH
ncbi:F0F1 ATP synthase subunit A [Propionibacteriaceae bacterium Y2011]|uniref:F0F1 ATP synthase subunit A n=1 Tax=Microlunatus sp. Y2014 TaxID=3418488 RepID=UPI003B4889F9